MNTDYPPDATPFTDDDQGFLTWLDAHPVGYFINADRNPKPKYLILHRPGCPHIDRARGLHLTKDYIKICADDRAALEEWAGGNVGGEPTLCPPASANPPAPTATRTRPGASMNGNSPNWNLILQAARALSAAGPTPVTRQSAYEWIWRRTPRSAHDRNSLDPTFQGVVENTPGGQPSACGTPFLRVGPGQYVLA